MELLRSKGTATQEEFDAAIDYLRLFAHRMGYDRSIYAPAPPEEYTPATPTSLADYAAYCSALDIFIENFFRYLQLSKRNRHIAACISFSVQRIPVRIYLQ